MYDQHDGAAGDAGAHEHVAQQVHAARELVHLPDRAREQLAALGLAEVGRRTVHSNLQLTVILKGPLHVAGGPDRQQPPDGRLHISL